MTTLINPQKNYYGVLQVSRKSTQEEIKKAYKRLCLIHHPDRGGDPEKMKDLNEAFEVLGDEETRTKYHILQKEYKRESKRKKWDLNDEQFRDPNASSTLKSFVVDSIMNFQEQFEVEIPESIQDSFPKAVEFVYRMWDAFGVEPEYDDDDIYINFGGFTIRVPREDDAENV